jgi:hypothetical protein
VGRAEACVEKLRRVNAEDPEYKPPLSVIDDAIKLARGRMAELAERRELMFEEEKKGIHI